MDFDNFNVKEKSERAVFFGCFFNIKLHLRYIDNFIHILNNNLVTTTYHTIRIVKLMVAIRANKNRTAHNLNLINALIRKLKIKTGFDT